MRGAAALVLAASVALVKTESYPQCKAAGSAYCAGGSLATDIIIRCDGPGSGIAGRCSNNLVGQPPQGTFPALCYQSSAEAGDAACEKNCIVYAQSTFTLDIAVCTPTFTASSSSVQPSLPTLSTSIDTTGTGQPTQSKPPTTTPTLTQTSPPGSTSGTCSKCSGSGGGSTKPPAPTSSNPSAPNGASSPTRNLGGILVVVGIAGALLA